MNQIRKRLTYSNVMSSIAVFLVLGGGAAFAATQLPKNSVGSPQIKKNAVKTGDIARNAVRTGKLAPEAAKAGKIAKNAIPTNRLRDNAVSTDKVQDSAITSGKLGDGAVSTSKLGDGSVTSGKLAAGAVTRDKLAEGNLVPRGLAFVKSNGEVNPAISIGIPNATHPSTGIYCFDLAFTPFHAQATGQSDGESNDIPSLNVGLAGGGLTGCPAGTDLQVEVWDTGVDEATSEEFFLAVW